MRYAHGLHVMALSLSQFALAADGVGELPSAECLRRAENGPLYPLVQIDDASSFEAAREQIVEACKGDALGYAVALEGLCTDGRKLLNTGSGYTNTVMLYTADGQFHSRIFQTDTASRPCMGQFAWPRYEFCAAPKVVTKFCGLFPMEAEPAFYDRWVE